MCADIQVQSCLDAIDGQAALGTWMGFTNPSSGHARAEQERPHRPDPSLLGGPGVQKLNVALSRRPWRLLVVRRLLVL